MAIEPTAFFILSACAFAWVGLDLLRKLLAGRGGTLPITFLLILAQLPLFLLWAAVDGRWQVAAGYWLPGLGCIVVNLAANLTYMRSVRLSGMSATLPLLSLTPVFTTLLAIPLLGEWPRPIEAAGIAVVVAGAVLLNTPSRASMSGWWHGVTREKGASWMAATALLWSLAPPLDKLALRHAGAGFHAVFMVTGIVLGLWWILFLGGRLGELRGHGRRTWGLLAAAAVVAGVALFFQLLAIQRIWVGLVETFKRGVGAVMALVLGRLVFSEQLSGRRLAAVLMMVVGVGLVLM
jgi:drug/metabolite transporter (DMT)-like permease